MTKKKHPTLHELEICANEKVFKLFKTQNTCGKKMRGLKKLAQVLLRFKPEQGSHRYHAFEKFSAVYLEHKIYIRMNFEVWNEYRYLQKTGMILTINRGQRKVTGVFVR